MGCIFIWRLNFSSMYLCVDLFIFIVIRVCWAPWMCRLFFVKFVKVSDFMSLSIFSVPFPLLPDSGNLCWYTWWLPTSLWGTFDFSSLFLPVLQFRSFPWVYFQVHGFLLPPALILSVFKHFEWVFHLRTIQFQSFLVHIIHF